MDPLAASANHSCEPNAIVVYDGPQVTFRTLRPISKHEEVFTSYVDVANPYHRRQHELNERFYFICRCSKCEKGATLLEDRFLKDPKTLEASWNMGIEWAPGAMSEFAQTDLADMTNFVGDDTNSAELERLQRLAFKKSDEASNKLAKDAFRILEEGLQLCLQTEIWPEYRQPLPSLRQQIFVRLLKPTLWAHAFLHGLRIYFCIHPFVYVQSFHPIRVIHNWTLAMLALLLADQHEPEVPNRLQDQGVDFSIVVIGLLMEVQNNVVQSHGGSSSFARIVSEKVQEVKFDTTRGDGKELKSIKTKIEAQWSVLRRLTNSNALDHALPSGALHEIPNVLG